MGNWHQIQAYISYRYQSMKGKSSVFAKSLKSDLAKLGVEGSNLSSVIALRQTLEKDKRTIKITDYGAGSKHQASDERVVGQIARYAGISHQHGELLFDLMRYYQPKTVIELGTSVGLSTMYMAQACPQAKIISHEGCDQTAAIALDNFQKLGMKNIELVVGQFENTLEQTLSKYKAPDWIYLDGNHRKAPTMAYFDQCLKHIDGEAILLFDDIHWSKEMDEAWIEIKAHPSVVRSIDLFKWGLVFIGNNKTKEDLVLNLL